MSEQTDTNKSSGFFTVGDKSEFDPEKWASTGCFDGGNEHEEQLPLPQRGTDTGISALIVGAGFAGLATALEFWRKGIEVVGILERNDGPNYSGMCFGSFVFNGIMSNLLVHRKLNVICRGSHHHSTISARNDASLATNAPRTQTRQGRRRDVLLPP